MKIMLTLILSFCTSLALAKEVPQVNKTVNDYSGLITQSEKDSIDKEIRDYAAKTTNRLGVLVIDSLDGDNLEDFSKRVFEKWQLGDAKKDNGVLLLFVMKDRKFRIEVGQGLEGNLTDVESKRIQDQVKPYLKNQQYGTAVLEEVRLVKSKIDQNAQKEAVSLSTPSGSDISVATKTSTPVDFDWSLVVYALAAILGISAIVSTVRHYSLKEAITNKKKELSEKRDKIVKAKSDAKEIAEKQKELRSLYQKSDQKKEDDLKKEVSRLNHQLDTKQQAVDELSRIAKKYGVKL